MIFTGSRKPGWQDRDPEKRRTALQHDPDPAIRKAATERLFRLLQTQQRQAGQWLRRLDELPRPAGVRRPVPCWNTSTQPGSGNGKP